METGSSWLLGSSGFELDEKNEGSEAGYTRRGADEVHSWSGFSLVVGSAGEISSGDLLETCVTDLWNPALI